MRLFKRKIHDNQEPCVALKPAFTEHSKDATEQPVEVTETPEERAKRLLLIENAGSPYDHMGLWI